MIGKAGWTRLGQGLLRQLRARRRPCRVVRGAAADDPTEIESLTLLRTPKYEAFLHPHERGVAVSFERFPDDDDERDLLQEVRLFRARRDRRDTTAARSYRLDVRKVDPEEITEMREVFRRMNFDGRFSADRDVTATLLCRRRCSAGAPDFAIARLQTRVNALTAHPGYDSAARRRATSICVR